MLISQEASVLWDILWKILIYKIIIIEGDDLNHIKDMIIPRRS